MIYKFDLSLYSNHDREGRSRTAREVASPRLVHIKRVPDLHRVLRASCHIRMDLVQGLMS